MWGGVRGGARQQRHQDGKGRGQWVRRPASSQASGRPEHQKQSQAAGLVLVRASEPWAVLGIKKGKARQGRKRSSTQPGTQFRGSRIPSYQLPSLLPFSVP